MLLALAAVPSYSPLAGAALGGNVGARLHDPAMSIGGRKKVVVTGLGVFTSLGGAWPRAFQPAAQ